MRAIPIVRYEQHSSECAVAASSSIANYYNKNINYESVRKFAACADDGMDSGQIGCLLNNLGFKSVLIITADNDIVDWTWRKYSRKRLAEELDKAIPKVESEQKSANKWLSAFLRKKGCRNRVIVDYRFSKYIRKYLDQKIPLILSFSWTLFFQQPKYDNNYKPNPVIGSSEYHAVVARGYNKQGVSVVDSHGGSYKYTLKSYSSGKYRMAWEELLPVIQCGDTVIPFNYDPSRVHKDILK